MPNYGLVVNSRFRPFSYQELLAPTLQATQAHQAVEDAYGELNTSASIWEGLANKERDPRTYQRYKNFADALEAQAQELAQNGLNPSSRQAMHNLRARYASDILPIKDAYERRRADIKAQQEVMLKDPTHFFNRNANEISLDEYLTNDKLDVLSDQYSGALLTQQVGQAAQTLKSTLMKKGNLTKLGLPYQYERMLQYGASAEDVMRAMSRDPEAAPILTKLVDDVMASSGIRNWSSMNGDWENNEMYRRAEAYAMQGLYNAIGTTKMEHFTDSYSMQNALAQKEFDRKVELEREKAKAKAEAEANANRLALSSLDLWNTGGYDNRAKVINDRMPNINSSSANPMAIYELYHNSKEKDAFFKDKPYIKKSRQEALEDKTLLAETRADIQRHNQENIQKNINTLRSGMKVVIQPEGKAITLTDYQRNPEYYNKKWSIFGVNNNAVRLRAGRLYDEARNNADNLWKQHIMDTYGVSDIINKEDYTFLQTLGLNRDSDFTSDYINAVNNTAKQYTIYGANLSDYSHEQERLTSNISAAVNNDRYKGSIYLMNRDGSKGKDVSSSDIGFISDPKDSINDIYYSKLHKGRIIVSTKSGQRLIVDPNLLDSGLANMISSYEARYADDPDMQELITVLIADKLNAVNPRRSKTSSDA